MKFRNGVVVFISVLAMLSLCPARSEAFFWDTWFLSADSLYQKGEEAYSKKNYKEALKFYDAAEKKGDVRSLYRLGCIYDKKLGVEKSSLNDKKAANYYKSAADHGSAAAYYSLGLLYEAGKGVTQNYKTAFMNYERAHNLNNPKAVMAMADMYINGRGAPLEPEKGYGLYVQAYKSGNKLALTGLGDCAKNGAGTKKNLKKAFDYYNAAAKAGNPLGWHKLGYAYYHGEGVKKDYKKSFSCFVTASKLQNGISEAEIGTMYLHGTGVKKDIQKAMTHLKNGAALDNSDAIMTLGDMYEVGIGVDRDIDTARKYYTLAAGLGNVIASNKLFYLNAQNKSASTQSAPAATEQNSSSIRNMSPRALVEMLRDSRYSPDGKQIGRAFDNLFEKQRWGIAGYLDGGRYIGGRVINSDIAVVSFSGYCESIVGNKVKMRIRFYVIRSGDGLKLIATEYSMIIDDVWTEGLPDWVQYELD